MKVHPYMWNPILFCYSLQVGLLFFADDDDDDEGLGRYTRSMLVSDDDDTGTGTGTGSRRCGALPQLSAWLAKGLAIPKVGIMQCLERRKAQERKMSTSSLLLLLLLHTCRMHVLPSKV